MWVYALLPIDYSDIPIECLEKALNLFEDIRINNPSFLPQFYSAVLNIINQNYVEPQSKASTVCEDDDLPF